MFFLRITEFLFVPTIISLNVSWTSISLQLRLVFALSSVYSVSICPLFLHFVYIKLWFLCNIFSCLTVCFEFVCNMSTLFLLIKCYCMLFFLSVIIFNCLSFTFDNCVYYVSAVPSYRQLTASCWVSLRFVRGSIFT